MKVLPWLVSVAIAATGCESSSSRPPATPPPGPYAPYGAAGYGPYTQPGYGAPPPAYGAPSPGYGAPPPYYGAPQQPPYGYGSATPGAPSPATPAPDPITLTDVPWLRERSRALLAELVAALPEDAKRRVATIPLAVDDTPGEVNAFAACTDRGAVMVVTDGLLDIAAHLAAARANDEVFRTNKVDEYVRLVAARQRPKEPVVKPPVGFFDPMQQADTRRVARQHDVLDELLGFVLGHEISHHYLGHLPCTGGQGGVGELARGLSSAVPLFNQPNELAADTSGTEDVLAAGARRSGYRLTEGGALLIMQFFTAMDQLSALDILFGFERTHPPPTLRIPVIQQTANYFRATGGAWLPLPRL